jgi:hypothetical protein
MVEGVGWVLVGRTAVVGVVGWARHIRLLKPSRPR